MRNSNVMRSTSLQGPSRGGPGWVDISTCQRGGAGYPLKRAASVDREYVPSSNGLYHGSNPVNGLREGVKLVLKSRGLTSTSNKGDRIEGTFGSNKIIYRALITIIAACFLAVTLMQGSLMMILQHADFISPLHSAAEVTPSSHDREHNSLSAGLRLFDCHSDVRLAAEQHTGLRSLPRQGINLPDVQNLKTVLIRQPRLALVCPNLNNAPESLYLLTIARKLQEIGFSLELFVQKGGYLRAVWEDVGVAVTLLKEKKIRAQRVDWLNYEGVIAISLDAKNILESLAQEPFLEVPVVWVIQESRLEQDVGVTKFQEIFKRVTVVVFPDYNFPIKFGSFNHGNFHVIVGSTLDIWEVQQYKENHARQELRAQAGFHSNEFVIVAVGSPCSYAEMWREHAVIMSAVSKLIANSSQHNVAFGPVNLVIVGHGNSSSSYEDVLQTVAHHMGLSEGVVKYLGFDKDLLGSLWIADVVVYSSVWEEPLFPSILVQAMNFERLVVAPDHNNIRQHIVDGVTGLLFPVGDYNVLAENLIQIRKNSTLREKIASDGKSLAYDFLAKDIVMGFAELLEKVLDFPAETILLQYMTENFSTTSWGWGWDFLVRSGSATNETVQTELWVPPMIKSDQMGLTNDSEQLDAESTYLNLLSETEWDEVRAGEIASIMEQLEEDELKERLDQARFTWEEVSKGVKKAEREREELHERDDREMERTGQPLCIYETYHGSGAWPFMHYDHPLYRGLSLSLMGRRGGLDDVDGVTRLPLLNDSYYRDALCEVGGHFAIANHIDRVHKNPWIGFQPWRASSRNVSLTVTAEKELVRSMRATKDGDALYFWAEMNVNSDKPEVNDFWDSCDFLNAGNCRMVFLNSFKHMYGLPANWTKLPPMPSNTGSWAAMNCWAMPTSSFEEFVLFARMFVDAIDAENYDEHHEKGVCALAASRSEGKHCYCRFLEGLVNVWAFHSGRKLIYVDPHTGNMQEQHAVDSRHGIMWVKWFTRGTLKAMDEDLAEEMDEDHPSRRWLWPRTGEVYWQGSLLRERRERYNLKMEKKQRNKERLARIRSRYKQKSLGRYVKPKP